MKKILVLALCLILALSTVAMAAEEKEKLYVGMECNYAPFNWTQAEASETSVALESGGYADGYDVQIALKLAEGLGRELVIVKTEWEGLPIALMSGTIDMIVAGMSPTEERKVSIDFSEPYYQSDLVIVVRKDSAYANATSLADFSGAKITGQISTKHYEVIDQIEGVNKWPAMDTFATMIVALSSGTIDGYVSERPGALAAATSNPDLTFVAFEEGMGFDINLDDSAVSVGLQKGSDLVEAVNEILAGIDAEAREELMAAAVANQPLSE